MNKNTRSASALSTPARASLWYTVGIICERAGSMLFTPVFTRILTPEEFGIYPLYISWLGIFTAFSTLGITGPVIYRAISRLEDRDGAVSSSVGIVTLFSLLSLLLYMIFKDGINAITGLNTPISVFLLVQIYVNGIQSLYLSVCRYEYKYRAVAGVGILSALLSPMLTLLLVSLTDLGGVARIVAPLLVSSAIGVFILVRIIARGAKIFSRRVWGYILSLSLPEIPHLISASLSLQIGRIAVGRVYGASELAKYSVAFSLGFLLSVISSGISSAISPWMSRKLLHGRGNTVGEVTGRLVFLLSLFTLLFFTAVPELFSFLAPEEYADALTAVYPIALSVPISFVSGLLVNVLTFYERTVYLTSSAIGTALLSLILNLSLTLRLGYLAAAIIIPVTALTELALLTLSVRMVMNKPIIRMSELAPCAIMLISLSAPIILLRESLISRLLFALALILIILPRRREYTSLIFERG